MMESGTMVCISVFGGLCIHECICVCVCWGVLRVTLIRKWAGQQCGILRQVSAKIGKVYAGRKGGLPAEVCCPESMGSSWGGSLSILLSVPCPWFCAQKAPSTSSNWIPGNRSAFSVFPFQQLAFSVGILSKSFPGHVLQTQGNKITPGRE